ncbi:hypothetical protein H6P81_015030 [Aristolochia fimbriata]|uniref:Cytochrome P450 n=1 Tax=Aristolochia fimbriata TaxID=158543 RepID=A0AAV7E431_ARIFI|nr:hypothetical protein H6P81_015030 [Aristolochia fimbriata]
MEASDVILVLTSIAIVFVLSSLLDQRRRRRTRLMPYTYPVIGHLVSLLRNRHRFYDWVTDVLSETTLPSKTIEVRPPFFGTPGVCTAEPTNVEHILRDNFPNYVKGPRFNAVLADFLGDGIFNADGELWAHQRKTAGHEFSTRSLKSFIADIVEAEIAGRLIPTLLSAAEAGNVVDLDDVFRRFTLDNICDLAFGDDPACLGPGREFPPFALAMDEATEICFHRFLSPLPWIWKAKRVLNVGSERRLRRAVKTIDDYLTRIVASREEEELIRTGNPPKQDLLSRFIEASRKENPNPGSSNQKRRKFLRDIILSFVFAGKDTTSTALSWFFWLLCENPRCEKRILDEIREVVLVSDADKIVPGYEEMKRMNYLQGMISESLRLYSPVPHNSRQSATDDVLPDGSRVGKGWFADYSAYAMGRMENLWGPDCREFKPERWLKKDGSFVAADQFRFPVFHGGPRSCLGKDMAYLQMKAVAAAVVTFFHVVKVGEEPPGYTVSLTPKMKGGLHVRLIKRNQSS